MSTINKISTIEAIALILVVSVNRLILYLPQNILISSGSSAILNVLYISIIAIFLTLVISILYKKFSGSDIFDISEFLGGKILKNIVGIFVVIYIIFISAILIREFCDILHILYYANTHVVYLILIFIIVACIASFISECSTIKTNLLICFLMILSLVFCFLLAIPNMTYQRIFPILGNGLQETFLNGLVNVFSFNGLMVLYFIPSMLQDSSSKNFNKIAIISVVITSILLVLSTVCLLLSFSFVTSIETISPLYLLISNNQFGEYFQHPESLFILVWVLSFMTYLNIAVMFILKILRKLVCVKNIRPFVIPLCIIIFISAILPESLISVRRINTIISKFIVGPIVFFFFPLLLFIANLKKRRNGNE